MTEVINVGGRPTKYRPEFDEMLIDHMAGGMSFESFAGVIGVCRATLYNMSDANPSFLDARKIGMEKCRFFWEKLGIGATAGKVENFNATCWIFNMKNRFGWRDKKDINVAAVKPTIIKRLNGEVYELGMSGDQREDELLEEP